MASYYNTTASYASPPAFKRSRSIKSDHEIDLNGPIEVVGSVKSGSSISLNGDVIVREKVDAYGSLGLNGSIRCDGRVKAYGNILVNGYTVANDKIKGCGKLRVVGTLEATDLEIYGNVSITGLLERKCRRLVVYGTLTLIGSDSSYYVTESEEVAGAVMMRETEPDWDW
ncbi:polymer-forming cytoskeletal domain-containing protein [Fusarium napiforme]|uniref:Polymer-forming cytoskeletal domain-containing protein n=1 Tax=Fusarium napiforme TaxID=42672 RepID=A0A8H5J289_9HYPO|nr:polymer-forming cytoskeletal domain-containing protein [Fusarium napiforme]